MNPEQQALLEQLNDIATPGEPGWWPLAIGWWVLAVLALLLIIVLVRLFRQRSENKQALLWRELALAEHQRIRASASGRSPDDSVPELAELSVLMRRVALAVLPRDQIASVTDQQWLSCLDELSRTDNYLSLIHI